MMKRIIGFLICSIYLNNYSTAQQEARTKDNRLVVLFPDGSWLFSDSIPLYGLKASSISNIEIPKVNRKEKIITHTGYSLLYNERHEQASWVCYELTKDETQKLYERTNSFLIDPKVKTGTANDNDYKGSGYDRGHLAPASDMGWSQESMTESFYYSNICPQDPSFNRGIWRRLEDQVRSWAVENNSVYIVTGPILNQSNYKTIGDNKVSIPDSYYKVILDYTNPSVKAIGFIIPNIGSKESLRLYSVSIDSIEKATNLDFFPLLEDSQEKLIEETLCIKCWSWEEDDTPKENVIKESESSQCKGITKTGSRCKNRTLSITGYCYHHTNQNTLNNKSEYPSQEKTTNKNEGKSSASVQCSGITKSGNRCRRMTTSSTGRCYQH